MMSRENGENGPSESQRHGGVSAGLSPTVVTQPISSAVELPPCPFTLTLGTEQPLYILLSASAHRPRFLVQVFIRTS